MCRSMVDIHSATAEIRRGKKEEEMKKKKETTGQKYNGLALFHGAAIESRTKSNNTIGGVVNMVLRRCR